MGPEDVVSGNWTKRNTDVKCLEQWSPETTSFGHTNHYNRLQIKQDPPSMSSERRLIRYEQLANQVQSVPDIFAVLGDAQDDEKPIFRAPEPPGKQAKHWQLGVSISPTVLRRCGSMITARDCHGFHHRSIGNHPHCPSRSRGLCQGPTTLAKSPEHGLLLL